jgi:hypothetical protein
MSVNLQNSMKIQFMPYIRYYADDTPDGGHQSISVQLHIHVPIYV